MKFGLLGRKLGHSYSPQIHALMGEDEYRLYEKEPSEVEDFIKHGAWDGINVTIPYKKDVVPFLDELSPHARALSSVNTIVRRPDGKLYGDNTDVYGFRMTVEMSGVSVEGCKALVFGSGGASVTACAVMRELGAQVIVISRSGENNYDNLYLHEDAQILVNTTPLGMWPNTGVSPVDISRFKNCRAAFDMVYNPARTDFLMQAERAGIPHAGGLLMLVAQAKRAREIFTGTEIDNAVIPEIVNIMQRQMQNIVIVGMPGCGKTTVGNALVDITSRELLDADEELVRDAGRSIPDIFAKDGEDVFRGMETATLKRIGGLSGKVIATGGGCVTREENYELLHQNGIIFWLKRDTSSLDREGRPLSQGADLEKMYARRAPLYEKFADYQVENDTPGNAAKKILELLNKHDF